MSFIDYFARLVCHGVSTLTADAVLHFVTHFKYFISLFFNALRSIFVTSNQFNSGSDIVQIRSLNSNLAAAIINAFNAIVKHPFLDAKNTVYFYAECVEPKSSTTL